MTCGGGTQSRSRTGGKGAWKELFFVADANICEDPSINGPTQVSRKKMKKASKNVNIHVNIL